MKRFWEAALAVPRLEGGYGVVLDGRPLRLPGGSILIMVPVLLAVGAPPEGIGICGSCGNTGMAIAILLPVTFGMDPLVGLTLLLGVYPSLVTDIIGPSVEALISDYHAAVPAAEAAPAARHQHCPGRR